MQPRLKWRLSAEILHHNPYYFSREETGILLSAIFQTIIQITNLTQSILNSYLVSPILAFSRGFEFVIVVSAATIFFAITVFIVLRQAKKLPRSYDIEITNILGQKVEIDGVRCGFLTHDVAESFSRMYQSSFGNQYKFRVIGSNPDSVT